ncbi:MAG TPA: zinc dependent phospholipase C family protein, partial [Candidatus Binataceae bacterium]|nr:zinc dependent phospholipase C family protein [Candidatus Binataceae bacterium]
LIAESSTVDEYAFALGVMAHYEGDTVGHPLATNLSVPVIYPKLEQRYGDAVTYADSPSAHLQTEFRFDILQVAHRHEVPQLFEHSIEFKVPEDFVNRVFKETYGLELNDLFTNFDVALTTYRWGFRTLIDEATGIAWQLYREDINSLEPGVVEKDFVKIIPRGDFENEFGHAFLEPGYFARFVGWMGNLVPNVGPFARLPYRPLPPNVRVLYFRAFRKASEQYQHELDNVRQKHFELQNLIFDTGVPDKPGVYQPADEAYVRLLKLHAKDHFARMPKPLAEDLARHFSNRDAALKFSESDSDREATLTALGEFESTIKQQISSARH